ncbi:unnamed protein product, partial [marine sediment metagenome]
LKKKLGSEKTNKAIKYIQEGLGKEAVDIVLDYYDKTYNYCLAQKKHLFASPAPAAELYCTFHK